MPDPQRIQRKRTPGWRLPEGAVCVTRGTAWGNPWREGTTNWSILPGGYIDRSGKVLTRQDAVDSYRNSIEYSPEMVAAVREKLAGKTLACWCKPGDICHGDFLLELANSAPALALPGPEIGIPAAKSTEG